VIDGTAASGTGAASAGGSGMGDLFEWDAGTYDSLPLPHKRWGPETTARLAAAGFTEIDVAVVPDPVALEPGDQIEAFLATVILGPLLRGLPPAERRPFVRAVAQRLPGPIIDYVRLQIRAVRP
jgi:hypothetical protein